jgi:CBS domain-containing protein
MVPIKDLMISSIISIDFQASAEAAAKLMCEKNISSLLVKESFA